MQEQIPWQCAFRRVPADSLPIYWAIRGDRAILYAPRLVCVLDQHEAPEVLHHIESLACETPLEDHRHASPLSGARQAAARLVEAAREAAGEVAASRQEFMAECLTIYVNNQCNMRCRYCYSKPDADMNGIVSEQGVRSAARLVAGMCAASNRPFTLAFHGGGEPTLVPLVLNRLLDIAREEAGRFRLQPRTYIATNGVVSRETARRLAERFDLVGVSCDGPPEIQDRHRPGRDGRPLSDYVGRTMSTLQQHGRPFHIRVTISRETVHCQEEIVSYLLERYAPAEIRLEPVYVNPSGEALPDGSYAAAFAGGFLAAQKIGEARGIPVATSITRPEAVYGPYCNVLRRVLNLVPGDFATGCFLESRLEGIKRRGVQTGSLDSIQGVFRMDAENIRSLIARCSVRPVGCSDCLCSCQCTFGCPDRCALETAESSPFYEGTRGSFRCLANRMLMEAMILDAADEASTCTRKGHCLEMRDTRRMPNVAVYRAAQSDEVGL